MGTEVGEFMSDTGWAILGFLAISTIGMLIIGHYDKEL